MEPLSWGAARAALDPNRSTRPPERMRPRHRAWSPTGSLRNKTDRRCARPLLDIGHAETGARAARIVPRATRENQRPERISRDSRREKPVAVHPVSPYI